MNGHHSDKRGAGLGALKFAEPLESEFRRSHAARLLESVRLPLWLALLLIGLLSLLDWRALPGDLAFNSNLVRLGLVAPAILVALLASYPGRLVRYAETTRKLAAGVWTFGTLMLIWLTRGAGIDSAAIWESLVVTLYIYLLLGLRLTSALPLASAVLLTACFLRAGAAGPDAAYGPIFLTFVNIIAALACFRAERTARSTFLENEVVSLVVGIDAVTGIPNRQAFNTQLHTLWRQAQRDSKRIAVLLVEIDYYQAFAEHYGQHVAELALRRVAHAVLRCARRPLDHAARFTDSRIALILFDPALEYLEAAATRVRSEIALLDIPNELPQAKGRLTVSISAAAMEATPGSSEDEVLGAAISALDGGERERHRLVIKLPRDTSESAILRGPWKSMTSPSGGS